MRPKKFFLFYIKELIIHSRLTILRLEEVQPVTKRQSTKLCAVFSLIKADVIKAEE
jgi:hypothetical protein